MPIKELHRLQKSLTEGKRVLKAEDVDKLVKAAVADGTPEAKAFMGDLLQRKGEFFDDVSYKKIADLAGVAARRAPSPTAVARLVRGSEARSLADDKVVLGPDGTLSASAEITPYVRGYNQKSESPLKMSFGSFTYPPSPVSNYFNSMLSPADRLERIGKAFGSKLEFNAKVANHEWYSNPKAPKWWGTCDAWAWSSLSRWVNERVDATGPEGVRGLWVGGEWMSRADLGNWMMALADTISVRENGIYFEEEPGPENLLKAVLAFMDDNGGGMVGDMWNDKRKLKKEVWNQPYTEARVVQTTLEPRVAERLIKQAQQQGVEGAHGAKHLKITGQYIKERGQDFEGDVKKGVRDSYPTVYVPDELGMMQSRHVPDGTEQQIWHMYAVTDERGNVLKAYYADDPAIKDVGGLPMYLSDPPPDYIWKPTLDFVYDAVTEEKNQIIDNNPVGAEYRFFVNTVLAKGVTGTARARFENEVLATPRAPIDATRAAAIAAAYPGMANAYSPRQWAENFAPLGLDAKAFGAAWQQQPPAPVTTPTTPPPTK